MTDSGKNGRNRSKCQLVFRINHILQLYAFTYKTLCLLKINAKAYDDDDISQFCKRKKEMK
jgi:hypothetical protein